MLDLCTAWWKDIIVEPEWLLVLDPECVPLPPSMAKMTPLLKGSVNFSFTTKHIVLIWAAIGAGASDGEVCETKCDFLASNYLWRIWIVRSAKQHVSAVLLRSLLCQRQKSRRKENYSALYEFLLGSWFKTLEGPNGRSRIISILSGAEKKGHRQCELPFSPLCFVFDVLAHHAANLHLSVSHLA